MQPYSEKVINAFLNNMKQVDICRETGLSKKTALRYKRDPEFQKILSERRAEITAEAAHKMQNYLTEGVETLIAIIRDPETPSQVKINGLQLMFNQARDWTTTVDIQSRLSALEGYERVEMRLFGGE